jgi:hypothetical protein
MPMPSLTPQTPEWQGNKHTTLSLIIDTQTKIHVKCMNIEDMLLHIFTYSFKVSATYKKMSSIRGGGGKQESYKLAIFVQFSFNYQTVWSCRHCVADMPVQHVLVQGSTTGSMCATSYEFHSYSLVQIIRILENMFFFCPAGIKVYLQYSMETIAIVERSRTVF